MLQKSHFYSCFPLIIYAKAKPLTPTPFSALAIFSERLGENLGIVMSKRSKGRGASSVQLERFSKTKRKSDGRDMNLGKRWKNMREMVMLVP